MDSTVDADVQMFVRNIPGELKLNPLWQPAIGKALRLVRLIIVFFQSWTPLRCPSEATKLRNIAADSKMVGECLSQAQATWTQKNTIDSTAVIVMVQSTFAQFMLVKAFVVLFVPNLLQYYSYIVVV